MPDPVHTTWQLARAAARTLATAEALQAYASSALGAPLTVYLDGLPADRRGIRARPRRRPGFPHPFRKSFHHLPYGQTDRRNKGAQPAPPLGTVRC